MSDANATIDFEKMDGLVPGIVQDARTGEVLMLGFLNEVSYAKTLESGYVTFWSRTRQKLWMKVPGPPRSAADSSFSTRRPMVDTTELFP